jgi:DNA-binding NarL/FixJ family response regulator
MGKPTRILLADDHPLMRAGLRTALESAGDLLVVGEADRGDTLPQQCRELRPDVLLLDLHMPGPGATITVAELQAACPALKILVLSAHDGDAYVRGMLAAGVAGYVCKDEDTDAIITAIRTVAGGGTWFSRPIADKLAQWATGEQPRVVILSERERTALRLIVAGKTNREIGQSLGLGEKSIERLVSTICAKLGVGSRVLAAVHAVREGLV